MICVVTGATSGIGKETAVALAKGGATVAMVCRTRDRGEAALAEIRRRAGHDAVSLFVADLSSQRAIRAVAAELQAALPRIDVLVNNAGLALRDRLVTEDGFENTFAVNHLAYFLLTRLLQPTLLASAPARVVNVSSEAHRWGSIRFDDLMGEVAYDGWKAYAQSKLANVLFTYELARRLDGTGVTANCLHPGLVGTAFASRGPSLIRILSRLARPLLRSPASGAATSVYLASAPEVATVTGQYFAGRRARRSSPASYDRALAARLWGVSERLVGF
ncbi:MAG TPA: SDR family oxidoreductase [Methylomirabilota bacterium]|jgi:retinol dehydrogenase-14|nr:SDR family oxidoreductase [Methylomirabilota bacterium]